jgi:hypothetical protein
MSIFAGQTLNQPKHAIPPEAAVIKLPNYRTEDAIGVVFGGSIAFAFNFVRRDGRCSVAGDDIRLASRLAAMGVTPELSDSQQGRLAEYIRLRIIRRLLADEYIVLDCDFSYTPEPDWRKLKGLELVFDEIAA